jgi:putative peptidoglycan lipid II flippase
MLTLERWSVSGDPFAISSAAVTPDGRPLGALGLSAAAGIAAWVEYLLLRRAVKRRLGKEQALSGFVIRLLLGALLAALLARGIDLVLPDMAPIPHALLLLPVFGLCYLGIASVLGIDEGARLLRRFRRRGA